MRAEIALLDVFIGRFKEGNRGFEKRIVLFCQRRFYENEIKRFLGRHL